MGFGIATDRFTVEYGVYVFKAMLSPEHCRRRAERLRVVLLCTTDAAASARLRENIARDKSLEANVPLDAVARFKSDLDRIIDKAHHSNIDLDLPICLIAGLRPCAEWIVTTAPVDRKSSLTT